MNRIINILFSSLVVLLSILCLLNITNPIALSYFIIGLVFAIGGFIGDIKDEHDLSILLIWLISFPLVILFWPLILTIENK